MKISKLATYFEKLESISGRLEMTAILADLLKESSVGEVDKVCYLALGRLGPKYEELEFNMAEKMMMRVLANSYSSEIDEVKKEYGKMGDLGLVAERLAKSHPTSPRLRGAGKSSVNDVFNELVEIAEDSGTGSQERKVSKFVQLLRKLDPLSSRFIVRVPVKKLRLGFSDIMIIEALSWMKTGTKELKKDIEHYYHLHPDIGLIAKLFKKGGLSALKKVNIGVGVPILLAASQRLNTAEEIVAKIGKVVYEDKLDGTRVQVHLDRDKKLKTNDQSQISFFGGERNDLPYIKTYTRNLEETTHMFPDLVRGTAKQIKARSAILDGEAIGVDEKTGKFLNFQKTIQRKRKHGVVETVSDIPLKLFLFDVLYLDGKVVMNKPFSERRKLLEKIVGTGKTVEVIMQGETDDPKVLEKAFKKARKAKLEGLMAKDLEAVYEAGSRGFAWIKYKGELDSIDLTVLGYYFGKGKRAQFGLGGFLVGAYDKKEDTFKSLTKIGTGLTDEQFREAKGRFDQVKVSKKPKEYEVQKELACDVWVKPKVVVEIVADEITKSPVSRAGYSLRFPRLISWRDDKAPEQATSTIEIERLFKLYRV